MNVRRLEEFCLLAVSGSYRSAASELGISSALLSNHISLLEKRLGTCLLERSAHSLCLTEAGKRFYADAKNIIAEYREVVESIGSISESEGRSLRIGFAGFTIPSKLGPYLDTVNYRYPNIRLELFDDRSHDIAHSVADGELDIFFTYAPGDRLIPGIEREEVYSTKVLALVPLHHPLAHKSSLSLSDLEGERFVLYPRGRETAYHDAEREILQRSGVSCSVYEGHACPSAHFIMVPVGKGLALCPRMMRSMIPPNTVALPVIDPAFETTMYMYYRVDSANPYLPEFLEGFRAFGMGG